MDDLLAQSYGQLRALGQSLLASSGGHSIQGTDLLHEAMLKLRSRSEYSSDQHFINAVAQAMRSVLIDRSRAKKTAKRSSGPREPLEAASVQPDPRTYFHEERQLAILDAMEALADPGQQSVLRLWITGHSRTRIATVLGITEAEANSSLRKSLSHIRINLQEQGYE